METRCRYGSATSEKETTSRQNRIECQWSLADLFGGGKFGAQCRQDGIIARADKLIIYNM